MAVDEKEYIVPLRRVILAPRYKRASKAVRVIRDFIARHMKVDASSVKLDPKLNEAVWAQGMPTKLKRIKVKVEKDEEGNVIVSLAS